MFKWNSVRSFALAVSFVVIPFVIAAPLVIAQDAPPALTKAREQFSTAAVKGDKMAAERLTTVDHVWVDRAGRVRDKKTWLQEMAPAAVKPCKSLPLMPLRKHSSKRKPRLTSCKSKLTLSPLKSPRRARRRRSC